MVTRFLSDTTAELPPELCRQHDIRIVSQYIHFGEETYRDEVDISAAEFYKKQAASKELPKTSAPPPADFLPHFKEWLEVDEQSTIFCIHPSSEVSGTVRSAYTAREQILEDFPSADIRVIDTRVVSVGLGLMVLAAVEATNSGVNPAELEARLTKMQHSMHTYFVVDTLEFLAKGGRIGRASHLMGSILDIKPILTLTDGVVESHSKARTRKKSLDLMYEIVVRQAEKLNKGEGTIHLGIAHADCEDEARQLAARLNETIKPEFSLFTVNGPAIGVHAGPGSLAVSCLSIP